MTKRRNRPGPVAASIEEKRSKYYGLAKYSFVVVFVSLLTDMAATATGQVVFLLLSGLVMTVAWYVAFRAFMDLDKKVAQKL